MKVRYFIFLMVLGVLPSYAQAKEIVKAKISGMVCPMCAHNIEKSFKPYIKNSTIEKFDVNLDTKIVTFELGESKKLSDENIATGIKDAGYLLKSIERVNK